jgi:hypothetical protein
VVPPASLSPESHMQSPQKAAFASHFLMYQKLYLFDVHNLMSLQISMHP